MLYSLPSDSKRIVPTIVRRAWCATLSRSCSPSRMTTLHRCFRSSGIVKKFILKNTQPQTPLDANPNFDIRGCVPLLNNTHTVGRSVVLEKLPLHTTLYAMVPPITVLGGVGANARRAVKWKMAASAQTVCARKVLKQHNFHLQPRCSSWLQ